MGFMENFGEKQAVKLIKHYTGIVVTPKFVASCDASIAPDWRGVVVLDDSSLWLVNRLGARGVERSNISLMPDSGQYPSGTRGYPKFHFSFAMLNGGGYFSVYPHTEDAGRRMQYFLETQKSRTSESVMRNEDSDKHLIQVKFCDKCQKEVKMSDLTCDDCKGTSFSHRKVEKSSISDSIPAQKPEFKICPMCAEQIKYAAKKCRYCQHMQEEI